jgi:hypothetical protein
MRKRFCDLCEKEIGEGRYTTVWAQQRAGKLEGDLFKLDVCEGCRKKLDLDNETVRGAFQVIMNVFKDRLQPIAEVCDVCHAQIYDKSKPHDEMIAGSHVTLIRAGTLNPFLLCKKCSTALSPQLTQEGMVQLLKKKLEGK